MSAVPFAVVVSGPHRLAFAGSPENVSHLVAVHSPSSVLPGAWPRQQDYLDRLHQETIQRRHDWLVRGSTEAWDWAPGTKPTAMDRALGGSK